MSCPLISLRLTLLRAVELQHSLRQSVQHTEATVEAQQSSLLKISKGMQELHRLLSAKPDKGDIEQCIQCVVAYRMIFDVIAMAMLSQMDRQIKHMEARLSSPRLHDRNPLESAIVKLV
jgi:hypothetical protein